MMSLSVVALRVFTLLQDRRQNVKKAIFLVRTPTFTPLLGFPIPTNAQLTRQMTFQRTKFVYLHLAAYLDDFITVTH
jgi:hypothetical protein